MDIPFKGRAVSAVLKGIVILSAARGVKAERPARL